VGILYTGGSTSGAKKLNVQACLADDEMPDWGDDTVDDDGPEIDRQRARVRELTSEALLRQYIFELIKIIV
jgi:hypothetical protein